MSKQADVALATDAASQALQAVMNENLNIVQNTVDAVERSDQQKSAPAVWPHRPRNILPRKIADSDLPPIIQSLKWRVKRGKRLGAVWMYKPESSVKKFIEQFGEQCSVMNKVPSNMALHPADGVNQCFVTFQVWEGDLQTVMAKLATKGWREVEPQHRHQLQLIAGGES